MLPCYLALSSTLPVLIRQKPVPQGSLERAILIYQLCFQISMEKREAEKTGTYLIDEKLNRCTVSP